MGKSATGGPSTLQFTSDGNIYLFEGALYQNQSNLSEDPTKAELIVKAANGNALLKLDGLTGNLYIRGTLYPEESQANVVMTSGKEFVIRHKDDTGENAQIILDSNGNLKMKGAVYSADNTKLFP